MTEIVTLTRNITLLGSGACCQERSGQFTTRLCK
jgi:hypothetical protein